MDSMIKSGVYSRGAAALLLTAGLALAGCSANGGNSSGGSSSGSSGSSGTSSSSGSSSGPNVLLQAFSSSGSFSPGAAFTLTWTSSDPAAQCAASGGATGDGWSGTQPADGSATVTESSNGTFTYVLTCVDSTGSGVGTASVAVGTASSSSSSSSGSSGSSSSSGGGIAAPTATVTLSPDPVAPSTSTTVSSTTLTWSSTNATSCTASGGDGSDGWGGTVHTSGTVTIPVPTVTGTYTYALNCSGPGGGGTGSGSLVVTKNFPPAISISASPSTVAVGGSTTISWNAPGASSCVASGGTGSDGWANPTEPSSGTQTITGLSTAGVYAYTLSCSNANGTSTNTSYVTVGTPPPPTVSVTVSPASIQPGQSATLTWSSTNDTSCTASGSWSGAQPTTGTASTGTLTTAGAYSFELTCSGPTGSAAAVALLQVSGASVADDCGVGKPSVALVSPAYTATGSGTGLCTLLSALDLPLCSTSNLANVTDGESNSFGTISVTVGALTLASESVTVGPAPSVTPPLLAGGTEVGFIVANPIDPVTVNLSQGLTISTLAQGAVVETSGSNSVTQLNVLSLINTGNSNAAFLSFTTTPGTTFDSIELTDSANVATVLGTVNVYGACVTTQ